MTAIIEYHNSSSNEPKHVHTYTEYNHVETVPGVIDISKKHRHGIHLTYDYKGILSCASYFQNGCKHGIEYRFDGDNILSEVTEYHNNQRVYRYTLYPSGSISSELNCVTNETKVYNAHGRMTSWCFSDDEYVYEISYKRAKPISATIKLKKTRQLWDIKWSDNGDLLHIKYVTAKLGGVKTIPTGFCFSRHGRANMFDVAHYYNGQCITSNVKQMCMNILNVTSDEEAMITLAVGADYRATIPEMVRYEYEKILETNPTIIYE